MVNATVLSHGDGQIFKVDSWAVVGRGYEGTEQ